MTALHLPTAYFIAGILYLIMPTSVWLLLRKQHTASNLPWYLGGLAFGFSLILLGLRTQLHDALTYGLANWLLILGPCLRVAALRHELKRPLRISWLLLASLVFTAVYHYFHVSLGNDNLRFIWTSLCASAAFIWLALLARDIHLRDHSHSAQWIYVFYLALGVTLSLRVPSTLMGYSQPTAMTSDPLSALLIFLGVATAIAGNIGFLGMFVERMNRRALEAAKVQAQQEEASRMSDQIAQLDRRRSVGEIAASLAHELSQPLTNIYLITERMDMAVKQRNDTSLDSYFRDIHRNTQKAGDILGRIRAFIRSKDTVLERVELGRVITDVTALIHDLAYNESVDVDVSLPEALVAVQADPVQLSQIFMNVLRNAIQATQGQAQRRLQIRAWREGQTAHITITDNGPGLSEATLGQVGRAFFSTKTDGLGVGFSISRSIAKHHGGTLHIGNHPSGGAVVELQLPAID